MKQKIYYVTSNKGKFEEVCDYIDRHSVGIQLELCPLDIQEIQSSDQLEIALDKARKAWNNVQHPLLIDDAEIYFERYKLFPGTLSKYVAQGMRFDGIKRLFDVGDKAHFLLHMVYIEGPNDIHSFQGRCDGHLIKPDTFQAHPELPYDAFFIPSGQTVTYAELRNTPLGEAYHCRIIALKKFLEWYNCPKIKSER